MHSPRTDSGFTTVELMVVVLIIGILVAVAVPVFAAVSSSVAERTCFANQRTIEGAAQSWVSTQTGRAVGDLAGDVDAAHPLVPRFVAAAPWCPSAGTRAAGVYTLTASGEVEDCAFGDPTAHGHY